MPVRTKVDPGRLFFESSASSSKTGSIDVPNGTGQAVRVTSSPGGVTYAPYSVDEWRKKIALVQSATTNLIGTKLSETRKSRFTEFKISNFVDLGFGTKSLKARGQIPATYGTPPVSAPSSLPLAHALASEDFLNDYYDKKSTIRGASTVAEAASTIAGLASPAKALRKEVRNLYDSLRKRAYRSNGRQVRDASKVIAGIWLEWNYGIAPTVSDANAAADAVNKMSEGDFRCVLPVKGTGYDRRVYDSFVNQGFPVANVNNVNLGSQALVDTAIYDQTIVVYRGAIRVAPDGGEVPLAMQFGVGFEDILPGVWEGIPWSFFFDYFFNISSVIDSWGNLYSGLGWSNRTVRNSRVHRYSDLRAVLPNSGKNTYFAGGGSGSLEFTSTLRSEIAPADMVPGFRMKLPHSATKWANLAALSAMFTPPSEARKPIFRPRGRRRR
jgi:hypothetical protein